MAASLELRHRFESWQSAAPQIQALAARSARLSDEEVRARQLGDLAAAGLEALSFLEMHTPAPQTWLETRHTLLTEAEKPSGLIRWVFLPDLRKLIDSAATTH